MPTMTKDKNATGAEQCTMDKYTQPNGPTLPTAPEDQLPSTPDNVTLLAPIMQSRNMLNALGSDVALLSMIFIVQSNGGGDKGLGCSGYGNHLAEEGNYAGGGDQGLALRVEDFEGRVHRNNLRFVGFPQGCEDQLVDTLLTLWLCSAVPAEALSYCFMVKQAHRALVRKPTQGSVLDQ
ncbi:hypothetical protein NDU88_004207 [Pleurodeles waltl]|uniref:Uncharacterized protein n=1 Tax=Pleurodeles waltl TaxID=8319 RepID=A0AAV7UFU6_PLEWA|nr:hypothetical protein NDU88_004207 [Pleurodeles waltl]